MKIIRGLVDFIPCFYTKQLSTSTALRQWGISTCMTCQFQALFCSHSQVFTVWTISSRVKYFVPQMVFFRAPNNLKSEYTCWGHKVDGVTMSHHILWRLPILLLPGEAKLVWKALWVLSEPWCMHQRCLLNGPGRQWPWPSCWWRHFGFFFSGRLKMVLFNRLPFILGSKW